MMIMIIMIMIMVIMIMTLVMMMMMILIMITITIQINQDLVEISKTCSQCNSQGFLSLRWPLEKTLHYCCEKMSTNLSNVIAHH